MANIETERLLKEAYQQVKEKADSYGNDGQYAAGVTILPPMPTRKRPVEEIASNINTESYLTDYIFNVTWWNDNETLADVLQQTEGLKHIHSLEKKGWRNKTLALNAAKDAYAKLIKELSPRFKRFSCKPCTRILPKADFAANDALQKANAQETIKLEGYALYYGSDWVDFIYVIPESVAEKLGWFLADNKPDLEDSE